LKSLVSVSYSVLFCYCFCNLNIFYIDKFYGSHFCLPVKNQRHDKAGINDCKNLGMVKFLQVIDPYRIMSLVFKSKTEMCYFVFSILKLLQQKWKEMRSSFSYLNFINESGTESRFILLYLNFQKSLIPTQSCLWFSKVKQRCVILFFPYLNLLKKSGKRGICSIPKLY